MTIAVDGKVSSYTSCASLQGFVVTIRFFLSSHIAPLNMQRKASSAVTNQLVGSVEAYKQIT